MQKVPFEEIKKLLDDIEYDLIEHEHVVTSEEAAKVRGLSIEEGMKSLVLKTSDGDMVLAVVRGDNKLHSNKLRKHLGVKDVRFASPEQVLETMGVEIGACYPFGVVPGITMVVDETISNNDFVSFNPGRHDITFRLKLRDYVDIMNPTFVDLVK